MTTIAEVLAWRTADLGFAARRWRTVGRLLDSTAADVDRRIDGVAEDEFSGGIRDAADTAIHEAGGRVRRDGGSMLRVAGALEEAERTLARAQRDLRDAIAAAEADGLKVDRVTGEITRRLRFGTIDIDDSRPTNMAEHRVAVGECFRRAELADERAAAGLEHCHPAGRHMHVPGVRLGVDEATAGVPHAHAEAVRGIFDEFGYAGDAGVTVLDTAPGTTAIVVGEVAEAENIVTLVPGTGSTPADLREQIDKVKGDYGDDTAVVVWTYEAPTGVVEAASAGHYRTAAPQLQAFQSTLAENTGAKLVVVGHSYGSTVVAQATKGLGLHADGVVLAASPGAGRGIRTVDDMNLRRGNGTRYSADETRERVTAVTTEHDVIRGAAAARVHGVDPTDPAFGAGAMGSKHVTNGQRWPRKYTPGPHSDDYFPDFRFRRGVEAFANSLPGSGPGTGPGSGSGSGSGLVAGTSAGTR